MAIITMGIDFTKNIFAMMKMGETVKRVEANSKLDSARVHRRSQRLHSQLQPHRLENR